jgi:hypothetical protein
VFRAVDIPVLVLVLAWLGLPPAAFTNAGLPDYFLSCPLPSIVDVISALIKVQNNAGTCVGAFF